MSRYVTPAGVVIEMSDAAAARIGYKAEAPSSEEKPKRQSGRPKKK